MTHMIVMEMTPEQRRKNVRVAWLLAVLVAFMFFTSIPFWKGMVSMMMASGL